MKKSTILLNTRCKQSLSEHSWSITSWQNRMLWCMWQDFSNSRGWMLGERFDYGNWVIRDPPFIHMQQRVSGIIQNLFDHLSLLKILWWVFPWKLWISIWCRDQTSFLSALFKKKKKKTTWRYSSQTPQTAKQIPNNDHKNTERKFMQPAGSPSSKVTQSQGRVVASCFHGMFLVPQETAAPRQTSCMDANLDACCQISSLRVISWA